MPRSLFVAAVLSTMTAASAYAEQVAISYPYTPYPLAQIKDEVHYPAAQPPGGTVSRHGEIECLADNVFGTHWFVGAYDAVWHFVTAGDPADKPILFVHGYPDTWWSWHEVMAHLADDSYVISVDTLGYGQSDKRLSLDLSYAGVARGLAALMDTIGIEAFDVVGHDRGAVIGDHVVAHDSMDGRILSHLRMQQSADQPHGLPRPPNAQMASAAFHPNENVINSKFNSDYFLIVMPLSHRDRANWEWYFPGTAEAAATQFEHGGFDKELEFRMAEVFPRTTMPFVFMQGADDSGQHPEEHWAPQISYRTAASKLSTQTILSKLKNQGL